MKRIRVTAPLPRPTMTAPLSDPRLRFMTAGPEGGEGAAGEGKAEKGEIASINPAMIRDGEHGVENGTHSTPDPSNDAGNADDEHGSQVDDPKLKAARDEAAQNRIKARDAQKAAEDAAAQNTALIQSIGKALGLVKDDDGEGETPDAEALAQQVSESQAKAAEAARELAVYKAARGANADPDKLLDSRSFLNSIKDVDPTDTTAVTKAVEDAVKANQSFALGRVSGASTADTASGPGGGSAPKAAVSIQDAVTAHYRNN